jgi:mannose-6-phosphate isomerase-like protein (cupin superfamily)
MDRFVSNRKKVTPSPVEGLFGGAGRFLRFPHYGEQDAPPFTVIAETEMAPGAYAGLHTQPDQQELLYILEGSGIFRIDGQQQDVGPGDAILARAGAEFALSNTGSSPLRYLVVKCRTVAG